MRAIVIKESLTSDTLPATMAAGVLREYPHELDEHTSITIVESMVKPETAEGLALELSRLLKDRLFYAHLVDDERMLVAFPRTVVEVRRGHEQDERTAQHVGQVFSIPLEQMQFLAMFDNDHPDALTRA